MMEGVKSEWRLDRGRVRVNIIYAGGARSSTG